MSATEASPAAQRLLTDARGRIPAAPVGRERRTEIAMGGSFAICAVALAVLVPTGAELSWPDALAATALLALAGCVIFEVGSFHTAPLQIAFVPLLFLVPPELAPLFVALALAASRAAQAIAGELAPQRIGLALGDAWFAIGPALVLALADAPAPSEAGAALLIAAFAAQVAVEALTSRVRESLHGASTWREQLREDRWIYLVDLLLSPVGLLVAFAAVERTWTLALVAPLFVLMLIFARERLARLESLIELSGAYRGTAYVLGDIVGHDDAYTAFHSQGVVELALDVGDVIGLEERRRRELEFGALLHDVGKVAIPKELINKPGPLTEAEWTVVKTHTIEGQQMLAKIGGLMHSIGRVVRSSHERYDGGGYPDGLAAEDIPIESRIICVCDAFNAMTTDRPYRRAMSVIEGIAELEAHSGTQFDPEIVAVLVAQLRARYGIER